ncbi:MAG: hypothetical protein RR557_05535 [Bacilli bacterium]
MKTAFRNLKTGIIALGIGKVIKDSMRVGMDAIESDNLFEVSMGKMSDTVRNWTEDVGNALGLSATEMRKTIGTVYNMTTSMGLAENNALKMSKGVTLLSNDMASFYNLSNEEAFNKINAGLTGETEPLKRLGILVDENTIKQVAYQQGIATTGSELTQQEKVMARYVAIMQQTTNAHGDLARTIDSPTNQLRQLKSQILNLGIAFGSFFMPILQAVIPYITAFAKVITIALNSLGALLGFKSSSAGKETAKINSNVGSIDNGLNSANKSAKKLKCTLAGFDEMNVLQDQSDDAGGAGGGISTGGGIPFDIGEYDAGLDGLTSKVDTIVDGMKIAFRGVGDVVKSIWNSEPIQVFAGAVMTYGQFIWDYWSTLGRSLLENISMTWSNISTNVEVSLSNMSLLWTTFWSDIEIGIKTWGQPIIDGVNNVFNSIWLTAIDPFIQLVTKAWADFTGILVTLWDEHGKPLVDNIGEFVTKTIALFQSIYDNVLEPIITPFLETLSWLWDKHISKIVEKVGDFVGELVNGALEIYNKFVQPIMMWLLDKLAPVWAFLGQAVIGVLGSIFAVISDVMGSILGILGGVIDFVVGVFTGNWQRAWGGIVEIFKNLISGIVGIFKFPINIIIDGMNSFISGLNRIKIPTWVPHVGGKGLYIPRIPKLARGGVVDRPTLSVIGEAGKEAVMPLENNTGWINQLAGKLSESNNNSNTSSNKIIIKIGEDTILEHILTGIKNKNFESNGEVFNL